MQIGLISLGCAKNQVDSELMQGLLKSEGNVMVDDLAEADIIIVNTCGFIQAAKEESINTILEAAEYKQGKCKGLIVAGCLSQRYANDLLDEIKEIDGLVGTGNFTSIGRVIERVARGERVADISEATYSYDDDIVRVGNASHSVFVKVAEGFDNRCSYCAIPIVRGSFRSRRQESILREVARLADAGVKEINLIAQDTTRYGLDLYGEFRLVDLLDKLLTLPGPQWFRLLYCYPAHFTDELIEKIASEPRIANYIDIPLQHISPRILELMHRRGTAAEVRQLISKLRTAIPDITIRTTFIVGFPGETDAEFEELVQFVQEMHFDHMGVFQYSREEGTPADTMEDHISDEVKQLRYDTLMSLQQHISFERNQRYVGRVIPVLVEEVWPEGGGVMGRAEKDAPEVDGEVYVRDTAAQPGDIIYARIEEALEYDLLGVYVLEPSQ